MPTPQADSFCPLQDARGHEVFLWQDFRYCPGHPRLQEQGLRLDEGTWNRLAEGLPTLVGVAKTDGARADFVFDEDVAFILTGPGPLTAYKNGVVDDYETAQLTCRMKYWAFARPAPQERLRAFKPCAWCWSRWVLHGEVEWQARRGIPPDAFMAKAIAALRDLRMAQAPTRPCPAHALATPGPAALSAPPPPAVAGP
eukprot:3581827-Lingulodinium_polyedra.AAC.1